MKILSYGSTSPQVQLMQTALIRAGYALSGGADGIFGAGTQTGLKSFQLTSGLLPDGICGPLTWNALMPWLLGYVTVTVKSGDTLYKLAQKYKTGISAILTANPTIEPANLQIGSRIVIPLSFDIVPRDIAFTSTAADICINGLTARYPFTKTGIAGYSVMGKELRYLSAGSGAQVFCNASHHANEWITSLFAMAFFEDYMKAIQNDLKIGGFDASRLYSSANYICIPMVNPDGVDLVTGELEKDSYFYKSAQRMNAGSLPFPAGWKANIQGIDLNLQYPAGWEMARKIKFAQGYTRPGPRDYVGPAPLTAPESAAVYKFTRANIFNLTLSYHSVGEVIYWKYDGYEPVNSLNIGKTLAKASGYELELTPSESGYAGYKDWFIQDYNRPGYTVEVGTGSSPVPLSQFAKIYADNVPLVTAALNEAMKIKEAGD